MNTPARNPSAFHTPDAAELLPARMLNEFVYCPRLFYYEHVLGVFVHNADTLRGAAQHKRVDGGKGAMPAASPRKKLKAANQKGEDDKPRPEEQGPPTKSEADSPGRPLESAAPSAPQEAPQSDEVIHSRSVMLGSLTLGVTAKLDLVEITPNERVDKTSAGSGDSDGHAVRNVSVSSPSDVRSPQWRVCPVEYKSGAPREGDDGRTLWDADKIQLGLQILILRENGYACDEGVIFYRQTRQRVRYTLTPEDEEWIRRTVVAARLATTGPIPPPLTGSPKCPRCSLVPICLPDETNLLSHAPDPEPERAEQLALPLEGTSSSDAADDAGAPANVDDFLSDLPEPQLPSLKPQTPVRRLIAPNTETRAFYVNTSGAWLSKKGETILVKDQKAVLSEVRMKDIHHLAVFGPVQISTSLIQSLCEKEITVSYFSMGGWFYGLTHGHGLTNVFTRIEQFKASAEPERALWLARLFVYGKIRNQRTLLMRNHVEPPARTLRALKYAASAALAANSLPTLLGIEGAAALHYFQQFGGMLKPGDDDPPDETKTSVSSRSGQLAFPFDFASRNRRPPVDPVNALLSFGYSLLVRECTVAAQAVGFDPYVGFLHQPRFGRPALALDVMEEFRPLLADSVVLSVINNRMLGPSDFVRAGAAVNLTASGRKTFLLAWEKRLSDTITHPVFDYKVSYRRAIELQFRLLAKTLTGEIEQYVPFMTR